MFFQDSHDLVLSAADVDLGPPPRAPRPAPVELLARVEGESILVHVLRERGVLRDETHLAV